MLTGPGTETRYFRIPPSTKGIGRPSTDSIIAKASSDDLLGIREIKRSPSSFDIRGITGRKTSFWLWAVGAKIAESEI